MDPLGKALITGAFVAALLALVHRFGQRLAGLLTGLPVITAPALLWLGLDRGAAFAALAAAGCVAAGAGCALFGLGYAWASRRSAPVPALAAGLLMAALPLPLWARGPLAPEAALLGSLAVCALCRAGLPARDRPAALPTPRRASLLLTAGAAAAVSGLVTWWAGELGAFWSGLWASAPLVAAVLSVRLHRDAGGSAVAPFLHGYLGGLVGRTCFAAAVALLAAQAALPACA